MKKIEIELKVILYVLVLRKHIEISTAGGEVIYLFFQKIILQTKFRSKTS